MKKAILCLSILTIIYSGSIFAQTIEEFNKMDKVKAIIETKFGNIELKFFPKLAPNHVKNFIKLAKEGFYDGTTFHRIISGFMIQGGDPNSKNEDKALHGMGGPGYTIDAEFNETKHKKGILSMARSQDPNSAGSQFFICVGDAFFLDGQYTVFGEVTSGIDVADKIVLQEKDGSDNPIERIEMKVKILETTKAKPKAKKKAKAKKKTKKKNVSK